MKRRWTRPRRRQASSPGSELESGASCDGRTEQTSNSPRDAGRRDAPRHTSRRFRQAHAVSSRKSPPQGRRRGWRPTLRARTVNRGFSLVGLLKPESPSPPSLVGDLVHWVAVRARARDRRRSGSLIHPTPRWVSEDLDHQRNANPIPRPAAGTELQDRRPNRAVTHAAALAVEHLADRSFSTAAECPRGPGSDVVRDSFPTWATEICQGMPAAIDLTSGGGSRFVGDERKLIRRRTPSWLHLKEAR